MLETDYNRILNIIENCTDESKLYTFIENAERKHIFEVRDAAIRKLEALVPQHKKGTLEYDFWQTLRLYELVLREDRKTKVRLYKTREEVKKAGVVETLSRWPIERLHQWAFNRLCTDGKEKMTGEGVIIRHADKFAPETVTAAQLRLQEAKIN